jgi:hypothetical protein
MEDDMGIVFFSNVLFGWKSLEYAGTEKESP